MASPHLVVVAAVLLYPALHLGCRLLPPGGQAATRLPGINEHKHEIGLMPI